MGAGKAKCIKYIASRQCAATEQPHNNNWITLRHQVDIYTSRRWWQVAALCMEHHASWPRGCCVATGALSKRTRCFAACPFGAFLCAYMLSLYTHSFIYISRVLAWVWVTVNSTARVYGVGFCVISLRFFDIHCRRLSHRATTARKAVSLMPRDILQGVPNPLDRDYVKSRLFWNY